jgi:hypothetical protein
MEVADAGQRNTIVRNLRLEADLPEAVFDEGRPEMPRLLQGRDNQGT